MKSRANGQALQNSSLEESIPPRSWHADPIYIESIMIQRTLIMRREMLPGCGSFYVKISKGHSGEVIGYTASILLIQAQLSLEDYEAAAVR